MVSSLPAWIHPLGRSAQRFGRAIRVGRAGAVAVLTALMAPVLFMIVGMAADYGYASYINQRLAKAADAATLAAVSQTAATAAGGYGDLSFLQAAGVYYFNNNIAQLLVSGVNFNLSVTSDGSGGVISSSTYSYASPTFFAGILGFKTFPLSGGAQTTARPLTYVNYYILIDTSQSMGIAATASDMTTLYNRVAANKNGGSDTGCVFGCHVKGPGQKYTNEDLAHNITQNWGPRINLRIDAAVTAIQSIISSAQNIAATTRNVKFGLYTIQEDPTTSPANLITNLNPKPQYPNPPPSPLPPSPPSSDYATMLSVAATIDLGNNTSGGVGDSDFHDEVSAFQTILNQAKITSNGSGASATSPMNYVFIITDGLSDVYGGNCKDGHCTSSFSSADCTSLKNVATVGVIYTTYGQIWTNNDPSQGLDQRYKDLVQGNVGQIPTSLQNCATSSDYYFEAAEGPQIVSSMQTLFQRTQPVTSRLTQ